MPEEPNFCLDRAGTAVRAVQRHTAGHRLRGRRFQRRLAPAPDLRERGAIALRAQAGAENALLRLDIDQRDRPDGELAGGRGGIVEPEQAVARSRTADFRVPVDLQCGRERRRLPDHREHAAAQIEREGKRAVVAVGPEFPDDRAVARPAPLPRIRRAIRRPGTAPPPCPERRARPISGDCRQQDGGAATGCARTDTRSQTNSALCPLRPRLMAGWPALAGRDLAAVVSGNTRRRPARRRPRSR